MDGTRGYVMDYEIKKDYLETHILGSILNGHISPPLDEMEFKDLVIDYKLFTSSQTVKLVAKAIHNMQKEKTPISDVLVQDYIEKRTDKLNVSEFYSIVCSGTGSYESVVSYIELLKKEDELHKTKERLRALR